MSARLPAPGPAGPTRRLTRRRLLGLGAAAGAAALLDPFGPAAHAAGHAAGQAAGQAAGAERATWPTEFALPDGFRPEGIAIDPRGRAYLGSLADGSLYRAELATGRGEVFSAGPAAGTPSLGLKVDPHGRLFVAGANGGDARVVDSRTGRTLASYRLTGGDSFINDLVVTRDAVWITDSLNAVLYGLPLGPGGRLPDAADLVRRPITGTFQQVPDSTCANGIETTPDGRALLVVNMTTGSLNRIDPRTGVAEDVDLGGTSLTWGDGLLRHGCELFVVRNFLDEIAVLRLTPDGRRAAPTRRITDPRFRIPSTVAAYGDRLYLPNARFDIDPLPTTPFNVVAVPRT
ncbi:SMP-30/gluconolactonase/LRE family protein [Kitasatospora sp. NPDC048365]|uniref:SMP-30/gluconolactonase/LRE family protein n=1 Tax=Kitasatospora sp. NPDC048365 TaxID=3364050 RepID=UPI003723AFDB